MEYIIILCSITILFIVLLVSHSARVECFNPAMTPSIAAQQQQQTLEKEKKQASDEVQGTSSKKVSEQAPAPGATPTMEMVKSASSSSALPTFKGPTQSEVTSDPQKYSQYFGPGTIITKYATGYLVTYPNGTVVSYNLKGEYIGASGTLPPPVPKQQSAAPTVPPACPDGRASGGFPCCPDGTPSDKGICASKQQFMQ